MQTLGQWLTDPIARLVTLTGPGGVGKTRLALEVAQTIAAIGATRVVFVPLAAIRNPAFVASAIAEALGLSDVAVRDLPQRARVACHGRPTLVVLDNFEQVLEAAPLVASLLKTVASLRLLVTSTRRAPCARRARIWGGTVIRPDTITRSPPPRASSTSACFCDPRCRWGRP